MFPKGNVAVFIDEDSWHCRVLVEQRLKALEATLRTPCVNTGLKRFSDASIGLQSNIASGRVTSLSGWIDRSTSCTFFPTHRGKAGFDLLPLSRQGQSLYSRTYSFSVLDQAP